MDEYDLLDPSSMEWDRAHGSRPQGIDLTAALNCEAMRAKLWSLGPGEALNYHQQAEQEELYFVVEGPGRMRIGDAFVDVPERGAIRVPPQTIRQVLNDTDDDRHVWLIVGAPPVENDGRPLDTS